MTHTNTIKAFAITTAALLSLAATASAGSTSFTTSFSYNNALSAETNYANFQTKAEAACKIQVRKAGYRATEIGARAARSNCQRQLLERAVKATHNNTLIAYHNYSVDPVNSTSKFARK